MFMLKCGLGHPERRAADTGTTDQSRSEYGRRREGESGTNTTGDGKRRRPQDEDKAGREGPGGPRCVCGRGAAELRLDSRHGRGSWGRCGAWSLQFPHPREPPACPGTWLGRIVHDSDESFSQQVVVSGFLSCSGHWKLDSLEFLRIHAWNREKGLAVSAATLPCPRRSLRT